MKIFKGTYYNEILNFIKEEKQRIEDETAPETQDEVTDETTDTSEVNTEPAQVEAQPAEQVQPSQPAETGEQPAEQSPEQSPEMVEDAAKIDPAAEQEAANNTQADPTITQAWQEFANKYNNFKELYNKAGFKSWDEFIQKVNGAAEESGGDPSAA